MRNSSAVVPFDFEGKEVRFVGDADNPWWIGADVCDVLEMKNSRMVLSRLEDDEKGVHIMDTLGGRQTFVTVNESGLWSLVLTSRKAQAKRFKKWLTSDVIPTIRKTGSYGASNEIKELRAILIQQSEAILSLTQRVAEHDNLFAYSAQNKMSGFQRLLDSTPDANALPATKEEFSAKAWIAENAPHLTQRQIICFCRAIAEHHRSFFDSQPSKHKGKYIYSNEQEHILQHVLSIIDKIPDVEVRPQPLLSPAIEVEVVEEVVEVKYERDLEQEKLDNLRLLADHYSQPIPVEVQNYRSFSGWCWDWCERYAELYEKCYNAKNIDVDIFCDKLHLKMVNYFLPNQARFSYIKKSYIWEDIDCVLPDDLYLKRIIIALDYAHEYDFNR